MIKTILFSILAMATMDSILFAQQKVSHDTYDFSNGIVKVKNKGKWGLVNKSGKQIAACLYDRIDNYREGLIEVRKEKKWGVIDDTGKEVVPCIYNYLKLDARSGEAKVEQNGLYFYIDIYNKGARVR